jgi:hypothetical protein
MSSEGNAKAYNEFRSKRSAEIETILLAKKELSKYQRAKRDINHMRERIIRLEARINAVVRAPHEIDVQSTPDPKSIEDMLNSASDLRTEYGSMIIHAEEICEYVERLICAAEGLPGEILYKRFVIGQGIDTIAHDHIYHRSQVYRLLDIGLLQVGKRCDKMRHIDMI